MIPNLVAMKITVSKKLDGPRCVAPPLSKALVGKSAGLEMEGTRPTTGRREKNIRPWVCPLPLLILIHPWQIVGATTSVEVSTVEEHFSVTILIVGLKPR